MKGQYISNKELYYEIIVSKAKGNLTRKSQQMFILMGERIHRKMTYKDPHIQEDTLSTAYMMVFDNKRWMNFDEDKTRNAFAYFTEIIKRGMAKGYNDHMKLKGVKENPVIFSIERSNDNQGLTNI